jgi:ATP synthase protein I
MADDGVGKPQNGSEEARDAELRARLQGLEARLDRVTRAEKPEAPKSGSSLSGSALGRAVRLSSELVAGVLVGGGLGLGLDHLAGTKPWGLIIFLMIGFAGGVLNLMRAAGLSGPPKEKSGSSGQLHERSGAPDL